MWYLMLSHTDLPPVSAEVSKETLTNHFAFLKRQHATGNILFSGPTPDRSMGIYVIKASSYDQALAIAAVSRFTSTAGMSPRGVGIASVRGGYRRRIAGNQKPCWLSTNVCHACLESALAEVVHGLMSTSQVIETRWCKYRRATG